MRLKEGLKRAAPAPLLMARRNRLNKKVVENHKHMSEAEAESWLCERYYSAIGEELDLANPRRYTEKIQWCKINAMDAQKSMLADKLAVREWVAARIGEGHLVPLLGTWADPDDIDFSQLPNSFVLKTNNASSTNIIVGDRGELNERLARKQLRSWLGWEFGWMSFEMQYLAIPPKVIAEQFVCGAGGAEIEDYKFLCFNGEPKFIWVDLDRHSHHTKVVFDADWVIQPWSQGGYQKPSRIPARPQRLEDLLEMVRELAAGFAQVRVDFYIVDGNPLFGEMTFTSGSGFSRISPIEWDYKLGAMWDLSLEPSCAWGGCCSD